MSTTSGPAVPFRIGSSTALPPMLIFAVSAMPAPPDIAFSETPVRTAYNALAGKRKRIVKPPEAFGLAERHQRAGEIGRRRSAGEHHAQARPDLAQPNAFLLGEAAVQRLQGRDLPRRRLGQGVA